MSLASSFGTFGDNDLSTQEGRAPDFAHGCKDCQGQLTNSVKWVLHGSPSV